MTEVADGVRHNATDGRPVGLVSQHGGNVQKSRIALTAGARVGGSHGTGHSMATQNLDGDV